MEGDIKIFIGNAKSWGHNAQIDHLFDTLEDLLEDH